jgi:putative ATP-dependent endonuclease of OLD family
VASSMKIKSIAVSNIRSFKYDSSFTNKATFNHSGLNLIIGPNGAGKSNLIEIMTRIFSSIYGAETASYNELKPLISVDKRPTNYNAEPGMPSTFTKNRSSPTSPSGILLEILLDETDLRNLRTIKDNAIVLQKVLNVNYIDIEGTGYNSRIYEMLETIPTEPTSYVIELSDTQENGSMLKKMFEKEHNIATAYLRAYRSICVAIDIYNDLLRPELFKEFEKNEAHAVSYQKAIDELGILPTAQPIKRLEPTLLLMSVQDRIAHIDLSYARLADTPVTGGSQNKMRNFERQLMQKSAMGGMNSAASECFELLKERVWYDCFDKISGSKTIDQTVADINSTNSLLKRLNAYLEWFDLKIRLAEFDPLRSFIQFTLTESTHMADIVDLSSGQRTILNIASNLTMGEELKSFVLIDEIENHLHPSVQARLRDALVELSTNGVQTIAVTHSPIFVNARTLEATARVYSTPNGSKIKMCSGALSGDAKAVVNVLQYTNGARVFFTSKVLLVEGPSDEEFFSAYIDKYHPKVDIEVIATGTKDQIENWKKIISQFDVRVYAISDLDSATKKTPTPIQAIEGGRSKVKSDFTPEVYEVLLAGVKSMRKKDRFILKEGALESYVPGTGDKVKSVREFINNGQWDQLNHADEIKEIIEAVVATSQYPLSVTP